MGATFKPRESFIAYISSGDVTAIAETLRFLPSGSITIKPKECFVAYVPSGIKIVKADTRRDISFTEKATAETERKISVVERHEVSTLREVARTETAEAASVRDLAAARVLIHPRNCFVAYVPSDIKTSETKAERNVAYTEKADADTRRLLGTVNATFILTNRSVLKTETSVAETVRNTSAPSAIVLHPRDYFIAYIPSGIKTANVKTERRLYFAGRCDASSVRDVVSTETACALAVRILDNPLLPHMASAKTSRTIVSMNTSSADAKRELSSLQTAIAAAVRIPALLSSVDADTLREIFKTDVFTADTARKIPYILRESETKTLEAYTSAGIQSIFVTLGERTLSDVFEMTTVKPVEIETPIKGNLLDYEYSFLVEETNQQNLLQTVKGMYGVDAMLYTPFSVTAAGTMCSTYVRQIADALGLSLSANFEDYEMAQDYSESGMTYQDLISALFGWTSRLPQRQINVFIRGETLHVLQRGMEESVLDITNWPHTRPIINRKLVRSVWNNRSNNDNDFNNRARSDSDDEQIPFTGTIGVGHVTLRYDGGYLVHEENNGDETYYGYDGRYLVAKNSYLKDGTVIKTTYKYYRTEKDIYLMSETEITDTSKVEGNEDADEEEATSTRATYHAPVGRGWYLTSVYIDEEFQGSSLSQGPPGGKASQYMVDAVNRHLSRTIGTTSESITLPGTSLIDTSFPVKGDVFLRKLTLAIEWLNRKVEENVSLEIVSNVRNGVPDITHVVDFTERIRLYGNEYFLMSNSIELTPRSLRQKLQLVRWC